MVREVRYSLIIQLVFLFTLLSNNAISQNQDIIIILTVGRFVIEKDYHTAIDTIKILNHILPCQLVPDNN